MSDSKHVKVKKVSEINSAPLFVKWGWKDHGTTTALQAL